MPSIRRSLTITEDNDIKVQNRRAMFLGGRNPMDIDYTLMVNILIDLGEMVFTQKWETDREMLERTAKKHRLGKEQQEQKVKNGKTQRRFREIKK